jgi:hypothetical protein
LDRPKPLAGSNHVLVSALPVAMTEVAL